MGSKLWVYHTPDFESDKLNLEMMKYSPWSGHRRFVYDLVANIRPECIVELGSYYGCSAFTFLQALKDFDMKSYFYAIDTWEGDSFTENDYKENIYDSYKNIQEKLFAGQNAIMKRMTFDKACCDFEEESIDLLHIDGSHTYEDCRHDFEKWFSKVSKKGIILFHDISDDRLDGELLGSHLFWQEIKEQFPFTLEFPYSFGLGVLFLDEEEYFQVQKVISFEYYQQLENHASVSHKDVIRKQYFELRDARKYIDFLKKQLSISQSHLHEYERTHKQKDDYIQELELSNKRLTSLCQGNQAEISRLNAEYEANIEAYRRDNEAKDKYITELLETIQKYKATVTAKDRYIEELEKAISDFKKTILGKDQYIEKLSKEVAQLNHTIQKLMEDIVMVNDERNDAVSAYKTTIEKKDGYIEELVKDIAALNALIREKETYEHKLASDVQKYEETMSGKERYIDELLDTIRKYEATVGGKEAYIQELLGKLKVLKEKDTKHSSEIALLEERYREQEQLLEEIKLENHDRQLRVLELQAELKKQLLSMREDQDRIMSLQQEITILTKQLADIRGHIKKMPFGDRILNRMETK